MSSAVRPDDLEAFVTLVGREAWQARIDAVVGAQPLPGARLTPSGRDVLQRHAIEVTIERFRRHRSGHPQAADERILRLAADALGLRDALPPSGRRRLAERFDEAMRNGRSLTGVFHLLRTAFLHRSRGHAVAFSGLADDASFDLTLSRDDGRAEVACQTVSAEAGRGVHRNAWSRLVDRVDPEVNAWLASHPGRYLLKMTLPRGLQVSDGNGHGDGLDALHSRITDLLGARHRALQDEWAVLRLDPLAITAPRVVLDTARLLSCLRGEFGPEAQISAVANGHGVFAMAAHAGGENDVPAAVRRGMETAARSRLTGAAPGILAMFVDDIGADEWARLGRDMSLERESRHFLTTDEARHVVTVACTSRHELFHPTEDDGERRFRNAFRRGTPAADPLASSTLSSF